MKKETKYFSTAVLVNGLQLLLCFIIYLLSLIVNVNNIIIASVMLIAEVVIWLICGFKLSVSGNMNKFAKLFLGVFIAVFPILMYTGISYTVSKLVAVESQGWTHFFFLGGPLVFFNKPVSLLMGMFKGSAYILFGVNYIIITVCYFIGELFGYAINGGKRRKNKKSEKEENNKIKKNNKKDKKSKKNKTADDVNETENIDNLNEIKIEEKTEYTGTEENIENSILIDTENNTDIKQTIEDNEDKLAEEIVNNILKENLKGQKNKNKDKE